MSDHEHDPDEIEQDIQTSNAPSMLSAEGREAWDRLTPIMEKAGRLKTTHLEPWTRYCNNTGLYWKWSAQLDKEGHTQQVVTVAKNGGEQQTMIRAHPLLKEVKQLHRLLALDEKEFGCTPLSSARLTAARVGNRGGSGELFPSTEPDPAANSASTPDMPDHEDPANFLRH